MSRTDPLAILGAWLARPQTQTRLLDFVLLSLVTEVGANTYSITGRLQVGQLDKCDALCGVEICGCDLPSCAAPLLTLTARHSFLPNCPPEPSAALSTPRHQTVSLPMPPEPSNLLTRRPLPL